MTDFRLTRREFVKGCGAAAIVGTTGASLMFADPVDAAVNSYDTVVHLFLRGGIDGLNLVVPIDGVDRGFYEEARPSLKIETSGAYGALPLTLFALGHGLLWLAFRIPARPLPAPPSAAWTSRCGPPASSSTPATSISAPR